MGKGEIAHKEKFLLFPVFSNLLEKFLPFSSNLKLSSANCISLKKSKIYHLGKGSPEKRISEQSKIMESNWKLPGTYQINYI